MDVESDAEHDDELLEGQEREGKRYFETSLEVAEEGEGALRETNEPVDTDFSDLYNLDISIAITEAETDEIDAEFADALSEIEGKKSFPCAKCNKVCKSKGGLTRHINSKHFEADIVGSGETSATNETSLCKDTVASIVESIKTKLIEEDLYGAETNTGLKSVSSSDALFEVLLPLYNTFWRKKNQDKLLESFYGLIPRSCELLKCKDYKLANLVMIQIPDHLVGFYNISQNRGQKESATKPELDPAERGPLSYIAGYVVSKLYQANRKKKDKCNEELQALLQNMKSTEATSSFISARTRGGLVTPCDDLVRILEDAEISFRKQVGEGELTLRNIPIDTMCMATLNSPTVKSLWDNIVVSSGVDPSSSTQKLCLESVIKLYLRVRSFSYARDYITKYKIREKQLKKKALRKDMKRSST